MIIRSILIIFSSLILEISLITFIGEVCSTYPVDPDLAHLQHYRRDCDDSFKRHIVKDTSIWRVKDIVISRAKDALQKLGFFSSDRS